MNNFNCSVCGHYDVVVGHGDGDFLCETCDDWRHDSVERERRARAAIMNAPEWRAAQAAAMAGYGKQLPISRRIWS